jgi:hypothetical protein
LAWVQEIPDEDGAENDLHVVTRMIVSEITDASGVITMPDGHGGIMARTKESQIGLGTETSGGDVQGRLLGGSVGETMDLDPDGVLGRGRDPEKRIDGEVMTSAEDLIDLLCNLRKCLVFSGSLHSCRESVSRRMNCQLP